MKCSNMVMNYMEFEDYYNIQKKLIRRYNNIMNTCCKGSIVSLFYSSPMEMINMTKYNLKLFFPSSKTDMQLLMS